MMNKVATSKRQRCDNGLVEEEEDKIMMTPCSFELLPSRSQLRVRRRRQRQPQRQRHRNRIGFRRYYQCTSISVLFFCMSLLMAFQIHSSVVESLSSSSSSSSKSSSLPLPTQTAMSTIMTASHQQPSSTAGIPLSKISAKQFVVLDGPEWTSIQSTLQRRQQQQQQQRSSSSLATQPRYTKVGVLNVVAGVRKPNDNDNGNGNNDGQRVIGLETTTIGHLDDESIAYIPDHVSDKDAISTYITSISGIYCSTTTKTKTTTATTTTADNMSSNTTAVVLGSSDIAQFTARGLSSLGVNTWIVTKDGKQFPFLSKTTCIPPAVTIRSTPSNNTNNDNNNEDEQGFADHIGQFDALIDTIGNEKSTGSSLRLDDDDDDDIMNDNNDDNDDDDNEGYGDDGTMMSIPISSISYGGSVLQLLKTKHSCSTYISTVTHSQTLISKDGIFSGPRNVDKYCQQLSKRISADYVAKLVSNGGQNDFSTNTDFQYVTSLPGFGPIISALLNNGIIYEDKKRRKLCNDKAYDGNTVRGWSLSDFWEQTSWPRDSRGTSNRRYGLPIRDDPEEETDAMFLVSESPYRAQNFQRVDMSVEEETAKGGYPVGVGGGTTANGGRAIQENPYVLNVVGINGVQSQVMEPKKDCIMFLSAKFCKTCKTINPIYTRMARLSQENDDSSTDGGSNDLCFVKAEASGALGKELGKFLSIDAVPAFVLYRKGKRFGIPLSVSKLPSKKLDRALSLLKSGDDWSSSYVLGEDTDLQ